MRKRIRLIKRDYWANGQNPYRAMLHDHTDRAIDTTACRYDLLADFNDGDEIEIIVRRTGKRPFGDRRYILQAPNRYDPETDEQMKARQSER